RCTAGADHLREGESPEHVIIDDVVIDEQNEVCPPGAAREVLKLLRVDSGCQLIDGDEGRTRTSRASFEPGPRSNTLGDVADQVINRLMKPRGCGKGGNLGS